MRRTNKNMEFKSHIREMGYKNYVELAQAAGVERSSIARLVDVQDAGRSIILNTTVESINSLGVDLSHIDITPHEELGGAMNDVESDYPDVYDHMERVDRHDLAHVLMDRLCNHSDRIGVVVYRRVVLCETLQSIGDDLNLTRERIRQISSKGLQMLRMYVRNYYKDMV